MTTSRQPPRPPLQRNGFSKLWAAYDRVLVVLNGNEHKLWNALRNQAWRADGVRKGHIRMSLNGIARRYRMGKATVQRAFRTLERFGLVEYRPSGIYLLDMDKPVETRAVATVDCDALATVDATVMRRNEPGEQMVKGGSGMGQGWPIPEPPLAHLRTTAVIDQIFIGRSVSDDLSEGTRKGPASGPLSACTEQPSTNDSARASVQSTARALLHTRELAEDERRQLRAKVAEIVSAAEAGRARLEKKEKT